jgi:hypothetical protein
MFGKLQNIAIIGWCVQSPWIMTTIWSSTVAMEKALTK